MLWPTKSLAQPKWQRSDPEIELGLQVFHSTKVLGLPTAAMLKTGDIEFEISHRFVPPITDGYDVLYGFDGPARMRLALGHAINDAWMITLGRSSIDANTDLCIKHSLLQSKESAMSYMAAVQAGVAWNPVETSRRDHRDSVIIRPKSHSRHFQSFGQLIIDLQPHPRLAVGLVPSFLYNRDISARDIENTFTLGTHGQWFVRSHLSFVGEYSFVLSNKSNSHNPVALGLELETGAHIFELFITNQVRINPSQYLAGAEFPFDADNLRIGFLINRIL
ncbi:MAG: DUF5777 family beta-barrel protein [candidate division Zixibacteria bacterium]|nr:DUF5777 family beta-barrel protein [candidate division Zixibacteria bacterium]